MGLTLKSLLRTLDLPWDTPAATIAPEWIMGPSWYRKIDRSHYSLVNIHKSSPPNHASIHIIIPYSEFIIFFQFYAPICRAMDHSLSAHWVSTKCPPSVCGHLARTRQAALGKNTLWTALSEYSLSTLWDWQCREGPILVYALHWPITLAIM